MSLPASPLYSTLELVRHDHNAGAPERDNAIVAPEKARVLDAPQVGWFLQGIGLADSTQTAPAQAPETTYWNAPPEAVIEDETKLVAEAAGSVPRSSRRLSKKATIVISVVIAAIIFAVAVGVGVGEGLNSRKTSKSTTSVLATTVTRTDTPRFVSRSLCYRNFIFTQNLRETPTVAPKLIERGIINDSSFAAIEPPETPGDRHIFFQEETGNIREAVYSAQDKRWIADLGFVIALDAKNHTPIATVSLGGQVGLALSETADSA